MLYICTFLYISDNRRVMIFVFIFMMVLAIVMLIVVAVLPDYFSKELSEKEVQNRLEDAMINAIPRYGIGFDFAATGTWDRIQQENECCGVQGRQDWAESPGVAMDSVPDSCCVSRTDECGFGVRVGGTGLFEAGCFQQLLDNGYFWDKVPDGNRDFVIIAGGFAGVLGLGGLIVFVLAVLAKSRD